MNLNEIDALWKVRHEPRQLEQCAMALQRGSESDFENRWRQSRLYHFQAMQALEKGDRKAAHDFYSRGEKTAENAVFLAADRVEGHFWLGVNMLEAAKTGNKLAMMAVLSRATRHLDHASQIDEAFHFAGPLRVLGRVTHFKPLILGGSIDRALAFYRSALQLAPDNSTTLLYYAEALQADQQWKELRRVLAQIIEAPVDVEWVWEQERDRQKARAILESL